MKKQKLVTDTDNPGLKKSIPIFLLLLLNNKIFLTLHAASSERENSFAAVKVLTLHILNLIYNVFNISHVAMTANKTQQLVNFVFGTETGLCEKEISSLSW